MKRSSSYRELLDSAPRRSPRTTRSCSRSRSTSAARGPARPATRAAAGTRDEQAGQVLRRASSAPCSRCFNASTSRSSGCSARSSTPTRCASPTTRSAARTSTAIARRPRRFDAGWSTLRADGAWHRTYWIAQWPRLPVGPVFLTPLLLGTQAVRTVSVVVEPVPPARARRAVEAAVTSDEADEELRQATRLPHHGACSAASSEATERREDELAAGHEELRFAGYVTVSGRDARRARATPATRSSRPRSRPTSSSAVWGEQDVGFVHGALPLGRGLRARERSAAPDVVARLAAPSATRTARRPPTRRRSIRSSPRAGSAAAARSSGSDLHGALVRLRPVRPLRAARHQQPEHVRRRRGRLGQVVAGEDATSTARRCSAAIPWIADPKGEYAPLARALGVEPIRLAPGGDVRLNPIARDAGWDGQLSLLRALAARRARAPARAGGGRRAARGAARRSTPSTPSRRCPRVVDAALPPDRRDGRAARHHAQRAGRADARPSRSALQRLCEGDLRGMFDGPTTPGLRLDGRAVVLDLSAFYDSAALGLVMTCAAAWQRAMIARAARRRRRDGPAAARRSSTSSTRPGARCRPRRRRVAAGRVQALAPRRRPEHRRHAPALRPRRRPARPAAASASSPKGCSTTRRRASIYRQVQDNVPRTRELLGLTSRRGRAAARARRRRRRCGRSASRELPRPAPALRASRRRSSTPTARMLDRRPADLTCATRPVGDASVRDRRRRGVRRRARARGAGRGLTAALAGLAVRRRLARARPRRVARGRDAAARTTSAIRALAWPTPSAASLPGAFGFWYATASSAASSPLVAVALRVGRVLTSGRRSRTGGRAGRRRASCGRCSRASRDAGPHHARPARPPAGRRRAGPVGARRSHRRRPARRPASRSRRSSSGEGPVLATSVKTDLLRDTIDARERARPRPALRPGRRAPDSTSASWTPLAGCGDMGRRAPDRRLAGRGRLDRQARARRRRLLVLGRGQAARAAAVRRGDVGGARWPTSSRGSTRRRRPTSMDAPRGRRRRRARSTRCEASVTRDERQRSSVYTTAETVLEAYADPGVLAHSRVRRHRRRRVPRRRAPHALPQRDRARAAPAAAGVRRADRVGRRGGVRTRGGDRAAARPAAADRARRGGEHRAAARPRRRSPRPAPATASSCSPSSRTSRRRTTAGAATAPTRSSTTTARR